MTPEQRERKLESLRLWRQRNKDKVARDYKIWAIANKGQRARTHKIWRDANAARLRPLKAKRFIERYHSNIQTNVAMRIKTRISKVLRGSKTQSTEQLLGCTFAQLVSHLESQFIEGMTLENHGLWHIDHEVPLSAFDLADEAQLLEACHYLNLQPLWARDNLSKGARL